MEDDFLGVRDCHAVVASLGWLEKDFGLGTDDQDGLHDDPVDFLAAGCLDHVQRLVRYLQGVVHDSGGQGFDCQGSWAGDCDHVRRVAGPYFDC